MNILALGAHPDDVEFLCSGTLLKYYQQGHKIFIALTTSGNTGSNVVKTKEELAEIREREQLEAAKGYDAQVRFMRFDDEGLQDTPETRRAVLTAIRWADPDVIFTNPPWDTSTDHAMTGKLVTEVLLSVGGKLHPADLPPISKAPSVFFWDIPAGMGFEPVAYVNITDQIEQKIELIKKHQSQFAWMNTFMDDDFTDYCRTLSRMRGIQGGFKYAEGFIGHKILGYVCDYRLLP
jgi:LmbE family N-acetylglucosaminyl deacetylase